MKDDGFTLVEMLITLAIISVVFALLSSVIGFGRDVLGIMTSSNVRIDGIALTKTLLTDTLSQVVDASQKGLSGMRNGLSVVAFAPPPLGLVAPTETAFGPDLENRGLQVSWTDANKGKGAVRRILSSEHVVAFSYFGLDRGWTPDWPATGVLPDLVRVQINGDGKSPAAEFTIAVKRLTPASCFSGVGADCGTLR